MTAAIRFDADAARALAALAARLAGRPEPSAPTPLAAALALAGATPLPARDALASPAPDGRVVAHERLQASLAGAFDPLAPVDAEAALDDAGAGATLRLRFAQHATVATLDAALRRVAPAALASPGPDASTRLAGAERARTAPVDAEATAAYLAAVRDPNPIHREAKHGLPAPLVPGGLIALLAEAAAGPSVAAGPLSLAARFAAPALVGEPVEIALWRRPGGAIRVLLLTPDLRLAAAVDLSPGA